jgi:valyl-tRNA synthetase
LTKLALNDLINENILKEVYVMGKMLDKKYDPADVEKRVYEFWLKGNYFHADVNPKKKPYTIMMPPPNITGQLHMGHALDMTIQDILIRWKRLEGYSALWLPGTDHASIATEAKIVENMAKEGITKEMIGREAFLERAWSWKEKYNNRIVDQLKKIGSSCDWERQRFTLDEGCSKAVRHVFNELYNKGLIYRGKRIINWCPNCKTSISDAEVEYVEKEGSFWHILYPLADGSGKVELATTRPETMLGDTAVAVNPEDERYSSLVGKTVILPIVNKEIPIIADDYVDMSFGTGVVKITPAHDPNDFEVGLRHNLEVINVMDDAGIINENGGKYCGKPGLEARKLIVEELDSLGLLCKTEAIKHNVGTCYRCGTTVEPKISTQWFVKMDKLSKPAIDAVEDKRIQFIPERMEKIYYNWMNNIKDWCISRQLWWGHRIPAWYCQDCGEMIVSEETPKKCTKCGSTKLVQDEDTLDTWFSSALWPFSTLGWPDKTPELSYFYPTDTLVTGYDIIFFWVARMIFSGLEDMKDIPFNTVFFHGLVRDAQGRKMSKSLGNGIEPMAEIDKYGADALRLTLVTGNSPGNDMRYSSEKVEASRNFANKIWNASRFIQMNIDDSIKCSIPDDVLLQLEDKWIITKFNRLAKAVTDNLDKFEIGIAVSKLYDFIWSDFCDWYIELAKIRLNGVSKPDSDVCKCVLVYIMSNTMKLLHPFMPFITEEIWQSLPHDGDALIVSQWPVLEENHIYDKEADLMEKIMELITAVRTRRSDMGIAPQKKSHMYIETKGENFYENKAEAIKKLASVSELKFEQPDIAQKMVTVVTEDCKAYLPLADLVDFDQEKARLQKELENAQKQLDTVNRKLNNPKFMEKAPKEVVDGVRDNGRHLAEIIKNINETMESY